MSVQNTSSLLILLSVSGALGVGCGHEEDGDHHASIAGVSTNAACPSNQSLTYANFGERFLQTYCLRCHSAKVSGDARMGAPTDHNFDVLEDVRSLAEHIDQYAGSGPAGTNTAMPKDVPAPSTEERRELSEWLACGAP